jgi:hypothetical protein
VQNCRIKPDFDLFLERKNGGPSPRAVDRARVAGPWWTHDRSSPRVGEKGEELRGSSLRASVADLTMRRGRRR